MQHLEDIAAKITDVGYVCNGHKQFKSNPNIILVNTVANINKLLRYPSKFHILLLIIYAHVRMCLHEVFRVGNFHLDNVHTYIRKCLVCRAFLR